MEKSEDEGYVSNPQLSWSTADRRSPVSLACGIVREQKRVPAMLELRSVSKYYSGIPVVDNVSFCARPGEVTGYLGPNGSGKTTTMKIVTGLIEMTLGQVLFQGKPI